MISRKRHLTESKSAPQGIVGPSPETVSSSIPLVSNKRADKENPELKKQFKINGSLAESDFTVSEPPYDSLFPEDVAPVLSANNMISSMRAASNSGTVGLIEARGNEDRAMEGSETVMLPAVVHDHASDNDKEQGVFR